MALYCKYTNEWGDTQFGFRNGMGTREAQGIDIEMQGYEFQRLHMFH